MKSALLLSVLMAATGCSAKPATPSMQPIVDITGDGRLLNPGGCSAKIGAGANYVENGQRLAGKCERGGAPPALLTSESNRYIRFTTNGSSGGGNDRTELAYTPMLSFDHPYLISYRIRIPEGAPVHPTGQMFYPLQIWQCSPLSPIAGMRVVQGTSHTVDVMVRSENRRTWVIARQTLIPGNWHRVELAMHPARDSSGSLVVRFDHKEIGSYQGPYGADPRLCTSPRNNASWRVKFGIYKSNNPNSQYLVDFDDVTVTTAD